MKRLLVLCAVALGGCAAFKAAPPPAPVATPPQVGQQIERVPFRLGVSSATVERLARRQACTGGQGAGLVTEPGPVEVYRMQCDGGKVFMARCELRQCRQM
jgi:hypothetical protein